MLKVGIGLFILKSFVKYILVILLYMSLKIMFREVDGFFVWCLYLFVFENKCLVFCKDLL